MSHPLIDLTTAVVAALDATEFSQDVTVARVYVPKFDPATETGLQIKVAPASDTREPGTGGSDEAEFVVQVGVFAKLSDTIANETTELDAAMTFCEEVRAALNRERLTDVEWAVCTRIEQLPVVSQAELDEGRVFATVLSCTFTADVDL